MFFKKTLVLSAVVLSAQLAWGSSDFFCSPTWTLDRSQYDNCSNLPVLAPGNDTRVNLKLLLVDNGFATLQSKTVTGECDECGYGKVPFSLETLDNSFFIPRDNSGAKRSYGYVDGSRCISNEAGRDDFISALEQCRELSATERKLLTEQRRYLNPVCDERPGSAKKSGATAPENGTSGAYREFGQYIGAAAAFYEGRYEEAGMVFSELAGSRQPWLREASRYMLGRTELNLSQRSAFDEYGYPEPGKADQKALQAAERSFNRYIKEYPQGRYTASARGLLRRIYWLSNQQQKLADEYDRQLNNLSQHPNLSLDDLVQEMDRKLLVDANPAQIRSPLLLATIDLALMRSTESTDARHLSFSDLQKQQPLFKSHRKLYEFLLASHRYYVQKDAAGALQALPDTLPATMSYLDFSRLVLRGLALESTGKRLAARKLWMELLPLSRQPLQPETLQLALALNHEKANDLDPLFRAGSPVTEPEIRAILLRNSASPTLLRKVIRAGYTSEQERRTALFTLLYKDLLQGQYRDYLRDYRLLAREKAGSKTKSGDRPNLGLFAWSGTKSDDGYACPSTLEIAGILAKNRQDPFGLVCLGDLVNANDLEWGRPASYTPDETAGRGELGTLPSLFPGELFSRGEAYKRIMAAGNASADLKAYALYRSIKCYSTAGDNHCGGVDVDPAVRKGWFRRLKSHYGNSAWAKRLKYYW